MIEGIRSIFPDALLRKKNSKGTWNSCQAEFEFKLSNFKLHKHNPKQCDLVICWKHNWKDCEVKVMAEGKFNRKSITYYDDGGLVYWTMGAPLEETIIINRCRKENSYEFRLLKGTIPESKSIAAEPKPLTAANRR